MTGEPSITDAQVKASLAGARLLQANAAKTEHRFHRWKISFGIAAIIFLHKYVPPKLEVYFWITLFLAFVAVIVVASRRKKLGTPLPLGVSPSSVKSPARPRPVKAFIVSNIVNALGTLTAIAVFMLAVFAALRAANHGPFPPGGFRPALLSLPALPYAAVAVAMLPPIFAGYIAADIAIDKPLLHGFLSSAAIISYNAYDLVLGPIFPPREPPFLSDTLDLIAGWSGPVLGLLGAYIWMQLRQRQESAVS